MAYVARGEKGISAVDVSDPSNLEILATFQPATPANFNSVAYADGRLYATSEKTLDNRYFWAFDVAQPGEIEPGLVFSGSAFGGLEAVVRDGWAFVARKQEASFERWDYVIEVYDVTQESPVLEREHRVSGDVTHMVLEGSDLYFDASWLPLFGGIATELGLIQASCG